MGILVDETDPNCREIPFHLPDATDPLTPITGHVFIAGEVKIWLPGAVAYVNASVLNVVEKGLGDYALRLTEAQTATAGSVFLYVDIGVTSQVWTSVERICDQISGIAFEETANDQREMAFHLSDETSPLDGLTGHVFVAGEVKIAMPGGVYANADETRVNEKGFGDYALVLTDAQTAARGKIYLAVVASGAQQWTSWDEIVAPAGSADETEPTVTPVTPEGELDPDYEIAAATPIVIDIEDETEIAYVGVFATMSGSDGKIAVYRRGAFEAPFDVYSYTSEPIAGVTRLTIRHNTGWPSGDIELSTDIVDTSGNLDT